MRRIIRLVSIVLIACMMFAMASCSSLFDFWGDITNPDKTAMKGESVVVDYKMMSFLFNDHIINWYNEYNVYITSGMFSIDFSRDLRDQTYGDRGNTMSGMAYETTFLGEYTGTWYDYFMDSVKSEVEMYIIYADAANACGLSLSEEEEKEIDDIIKNIKDNLKESNAEISDWYGREVGEEDIRRSYELIYLANNFAEYYQEKLEGEISQDEIVTYREKNKELFYTADCLTYTVTKSSKGLTAEEFEEAKNAVNKIADALANAKSPAEFVMIVEKYENSLGGNGDYEYGTEEENYGVSEDEIEKYKETFNYNKEENSLNDFLFGRDGDVYDEIDAASAGDATVITETETFTEHAKIEASAEGDEYEEIKTYVKYSATVYYVTDPMHFDTELTHNFAYLVTDDRQQALKVFSKFNTESKRYDKSIHFDLFIDIAQREQKKDTPDEDSDSNGSIYEFNKLKGQSADVFPANFKVLNDWIEDPNRKNGDYTYIIEIETTKTNSTTNKTEISYQYLLLYFDSHGDETWYVLAFDGAVSEKFDNWFADRLEYNRPKSYDQVIYDTEAKLYFWLSDK